MFYEPMNVTLVTDVGGAHPEPAHDPSWSRIDQLRWEAGLIKARTGVTVRFSDHHYYVCGDSYQKWPELIGVHVDHSSQSVRDEDMHMFLRGVDTGAWAANERASDDGWTEYLERGQE